MPLYLFSSILKRFFWENNGEDVDLGGGPWAHCLLEMKHRMDASNGKNMSRVTSGFN